MTLRSARAPPPTALATFETFPGGLAELAHTLEGMHARSLPALSARSRLPGRRAWDQVSWPLEPARARELARAFRASRDAPRR